MKTDRFFTRFLSIFLAGGLALPASAFALRAIENTEGAAPVWAGLEEPVGKPQIDRAIQLIAQPTFLPDVVLPEERPHLTGLFRRVAVVPVEGKEISVEGDVIHFGTSPERDETAIAHLLVWAGRARRAVGLIAAQAKKTSSTKPGLAQRLAAAAEILPTVSIRLRTVGATSAREGKISLLVGDAVTSQQLAAELVPAAEQIAQTRPGASAAPARNAEDLGAAFLENDDATRRRMEEAREQGESEGAAARAKEARPVEPVVDKELIGRITKHLELGEGRFTLADTWPVFAEGLSAVLQLSNEDRLVEFLEGLINAFGLIHYSRQSIDDQGVRDPQSAALNSATEAVEMLADALGRYLNDPFLGQQGSVSRRQALAEAARGMAMENLLSYLRHEHIPALLAQKIDQLEVSPEIAARILRAERAAGVTGMTQTMQHSARGMLTSERLRLTGPRTDGSSAESSLREPQPYIPGLDPDVGYRLGADGLIDGFLEVLKKKPVLDNLVVPSNLLDNVQLALSRPREITPNGSDELSDLLRFYHYLGSVGKLQAAWRPFLKGIDLSAAAKEFNLSERAIVAGLFLWRVLQPSLNSDAEAVLFAHLDTLGQSTDAIFGFVAEFQRRFKNAQAAQARVTQTARETHHAEVMLETAAVQEQLTAQRAAEVRRRAEEFQEFGYALAGASSSGGTAESAVLSNVVTFEGFVYRLHRMDLGDEQVRILNVNREAAQEAMARLVGGEKKKEQGFSSGRRAVMRPLHADRKDDPLRLFVAGDVEGTPLAQALFAFLDGFQRFPEGGWWSEGTLGSQLGAFQNALPDFATAQWEVGQAKEKAMEGRIAALEKLVQELASRLRAIEEKAPQHQPATGLEEQKGPLRFIVDTHQLEWGQGDPRVLHLATLAFRLQREGVPIEVAAVATEEELAEAQVEITDPGLRRRLGDFAYFYVPGDAEGHAEALAQARLLVPVPTSDLIITEIDPLTLGWFLEQLQLLGIQELDAGVQDRIEAFLSEAFFA